MSLPRIQPHEGSRRLVTESGEPFFWLGDTAWELFHRLTLAEAETYLETRRRQGFNVIQACPHRSRCAWAASVRRRCAISSSTRA